MRIFQYFLLILLFNPFNMIYLYQLKENKIYAQSLDEGGPSSPPKLFVPGQTSQNAPTKDNSKNFADAYIEDITNKNFPELVESFDFQNADISDVIKSISKLTGKNFIIDVQNLRGKITIIAPSRITVAEAYKAFLSALAINNLTVVPTPDGKFLKIVTARIAQKSSEIFTGSYTPNTDQMITRLIQLKHTKASDANTLLRTLITAQGIIQHHEPTNTLVITDFGSNINKIMRVIEQIDASSVNEQMVVIPIRFARAKNIAELIEKIINKGETPSKGRNRSNLPRFNRGRQQAGQKSDSAFSLVLPDERTNSIIVLANRQGIIEIRRLVKRLDFAIEDEGGLYVYYVKHGKAEDITKTINSIAEDKRKAPGSKKAPLGRPPFRPGNTPTEPSDAIGAGLLGGEVKITHNEQTNSLIIASGRQDYEVILNLLAKIDIPRDQVFVEAIILEMAVNDELNYGFNILGILPNTNGLGRAGFVSPDGLSNFINVIGSTGLVLGFGAGSPVTINPSPLQGANSATGIEVRSVNGFVNFLKKVTEVNVLSTPQILALDNAEAEIEVGERIPIGQNIQANTTGITQSRPDYEEANIKLKIVPQISSDRETVRLEIDQSIKDVVDRTVKAPSFTTRALKSDVVVRNGDTIVIGGLMRDTEAPTINKVPILGDIPILGWLFKSKQVTVRKVNLLVFITPRIIRTRADARRLSDFKLKERLQFIKDVGGRDAHGRKIEEIRIANSKNHVATEDLLEDTIEDFQDQEDDSEESIGNNISDQSIEEELLSAEIEDFPAEPEENIEGDIEDEDEIRIEF